MIEGVGLELDARRNVKADTAGTELLRSVRGRYHAEGQSLVVWAIREGRQGGDCRPTSFDAADRLAALSAAHYAFTGGSIQRRREHGGYRGQSIDRTPRSERGAARSAN